MVPPSSSYPIWNPLMYPHSMCGEYLAHGQPYLRSLSAQTVNGWLFHSMTQTWMNHPRGFRLHRYLSVVLVCMPMFVGLTELLHYCRQHVLPGFLPYWMRTRHRLSHCDNLSRWRTIQYLANQDWRSILDAALWQLGRILTSTLPYGRSRWRVRGHLQAAWGSHSDREAGDGLNGTRMPPARTEAAAGYTAALHRLSPLSTHLQQEMCSMEPLLCASLKAAGPFDKLVYEQRLQQL